MDQQPPAEELKKCPYCGKMTSSKANFCYYCARELVARPERPAEQEKPAPINWTLVGFAVLLVVIVVVYLLVR